MAFDGSQFIAHMAERLIRDFEFSADAGTPGLTGAAKEFPAREQLKSFLPFGTNVGSGLVVDSYGNVSKQQDIVIYEELCPVFSRNGAPEATYYPIEGVIACGEVKSTLTKTELVDGFQKSRSVKSLRRRAEAENSMLSSNTIVPFRGYRTTQTIAGTATEAYDQDRKSLDQVFTFILCEKFGVSASAILSNAAIQCKESGVLGAVNFIASLKDGFIFPFDEPSRSLRLAPFEASGLVFCGVPSATMHQLLEKIRHVTLSGRTVRLKHFERYFRSDKEGDGNLPITEAILF